MEIIKANSSKAYTFNFIIAHNASEAYSKINVENAANKKINLAFLDVTIPASGAIKSGIDLVELIKQHNPTCRIIIITAFTESLKIYKSANPQEKETLA